MYSALNKVSSFGLCGSSSHACRPTVLWDLIQTNRNVAGDFSIFTLSNWFLRTEIPYRTPSSSTWWGIYILFLQIVQIAPKLSKLPMKNHKQVTSLLLYICIILSWWCSVTGLAQQLTGLFPGPAQLMKLADSYAQFSDAFNFLPGSWVEQAYGGVCWMPELNNVSWHGNWSQQQNW